MPDPRPDESHDDFVSRCIPIVLDDGTAENQDQAVAVCNSMWENRKVDANQKLLDAIRSRKNRRAEFGYGITTADQYVRRVFDECGAGLACREFAHGENVEAVVKVAQGKLVCANPDMVVEKRAMQAGKFAELVPEGIELPEATLMVMRHVVTTPREDRDRDVLVTDGASLDPKAPLLWQHMHTMPLGKVVATIEHTPDVLRVASALLDINDITSDAAKLIEADALRFSHGFRALEFEERKRETGDDSGMIPGFKITKFEIMEVSLVSVPSNVDAEVEMFSRGKLASDFFKAHAKHYLDQRPVQVAGGLGTQLTLKLGDAQIEVKQIEKPTEKERELDRSQSENAMPQEHDEKQPEQQQTIEPDTPKDTEEKRGRVLSARNLQTLKDVRDDLEELSGMEGISRAGKSLCERCMTKLDAVIKQAEGPDEEEAPRDITPKEAAQIILAQADRELRERLHDALSAMFTTEQLDAKAEEFRRAIAR